jgi:gluconate 2-dehydrogenase gamma chain
MSGDRVSRRNLLKAGAAAGTLAVASGALAGEAAARTIQGEVPWQPSDADAPTPVAPGPYQFLNPDEAAFVEAAADRLIPADEHGPSARSLGGAIFIDRQLAGDYGTAQHWYMQGPWEKGTPSQGYQLRFTPAQLYRVGIKATDDYCRKNFAGKRFADLAPDAQDEVLSRLETGKAELDGVDAGTFFAQLLQNTIEGFFADPLYGGNKDMASWKMIGFAGARYDHRDWVAKHNEKYPLPPVSIYGRAGWQTKT